MDEAHHGEGGQTGRDHLRDVGRQGDGHRGWEEGGERVACCEGGGQQGEGQPGDEQGGSGNELGQAEV